MKNSSMTPSSERVIELGWSLVPEPQACDDSWSRTLLESKSPTSTKFHQPPGKGWRVERSNKQLQLSLYLSPFPVLDLNALDPEKAGVWIRVESLNYRETQSSIRDARYFSKSIKVTSPPEANPARQPEELTVTFTTLKEELLFECEDITWRSIQPYVSTWQELIG